MPEFDVDYIALSKIYDSLPDEQNYFHSTQLFWVSFGNLKCYSITNRIQQKFAIRQFEVLVSLQEATNHLAVSLLVL